MFFFPGGRVGGALPPRRAGYGSGKSRGHQRRPVADTWSATAPGKTESGPGTIRSRRIDLTRPDPEGVGGFLKGPFFIESGQLAVTRGVVERRGGSGIKAVTVMM